MEYPSTSLLYVKSLVDSDGFRFKVCVESSPSLLHCTQCVVISDPGITSLQTIHLGFCTLCFFYLSLRQ